MTKTLQDTVGLLTPAVTIVLVFWVVVVGGFLVVVVVVVEVVVAGFHGVQGLSVDVVVVSGGQSPAKEKDRLKSIHILNENILLNHSLHRLQHIHTYFRFRNHNRKRK